MRYRALLLEVSIAEHPLCILIAINQAVQNAKDKLEITKRLAIGYWPFPADAGINFFDINH
jgi:hypothetical protein